MLLPDQTHSFELATAFKVQGGGQGSVSDSRANIDSAFVLVATARGYSCQPTAWGPAPRAFWNYAGAPDAPYSLPDLRQLVKSFVDPTLGVNIGNAATVPGQYPP